MNKKQYVINTVMSQTVPFYSTTIQTLSGCSSALVHNTLSDLLESGKIASRREGKKIVYTLNDIPNNKHIDITISQICTIAEKFQYIRDLVDMVIKGVQPSVLISGQPGVGKSYIVRQQLQNAKLVEGKDYLQVNGHSSPFGLYKLLYEHNDYTIVFDDVDSIFQNDISTNILKAALDSYNTRQVAWYSDKALQQGLDPYFEFKGKIIFISNLFLDKIDSAVRSRAFCFNLKMTNNEISEHMQNILADIEPDVSMELKQEVLNYLKTIQDDFLVYSLRTLIQAIRIRKYCTGSEKDWKNMVQVLTYDV